MLKSLWAGALAGIASMAPLAVNAGAGVSLGLGRHVGFQLMAKDYMGRFDAREATLVNVKSPTSHNLALSAGLRLGL